MLKVGGINLVKMHSVILATLMLAGTSSAQSTSNNLPGTISGAVLGEDGKALANATVFALPEQDMRKQIRATADANGNFTLQSVPAGTVYLDAFKESDGYPYNFFAFFKGPGEQTPTVHLAPGENLRSVVVKLGPKAATLHVEVTQSDGTPIIQTATLAFTRGDLGAPYTVGAKAHHAMLVPSSVPFQCSVAVPGYKPWSRNLLRPARAKV